MLVLLHATFGRCVSRRSKDLKIQNGKFYHQAGAVWGLSLSNLTNKLIYLSRGFWALNNTCGMATCKQLILITIAVEHHQVFHANDWPKVRRSCFYFVNNPFWCKQFSIICKILRYGNCSHFRSAALLEVNFNKGTARWIKCPQKIVLRIGGFHQMMIFLGSIRSVIQRSGLN